MKRIFNYFSVVARFEKSQFVQIKQLQIQRDIEFCYLVLLSLFVIIRM